MGQKYIGDAVMPVRLHNRSVPGARELAAIFDGVSLLAEYPAACSGNLNSMHRLESGPASIAAGCRPATWGGSLPRIYIALGDAVNMAFRLESR